MLPDGSHLRSPGIEETQIVYLYYDIEPGHFSLGKVLPNHVIHEKHLGFRMIYKVMDILRLEFVENRNRNGSVSQCGEERYSPVGLVPCAKGNLVTLLKSTLFESDVKLGNSSCHIPIGEILSLVI